MDSSALRPCELKRFEEIEKADILFVIPSFNKKTGGRTQSR
jgi:hypothetical protein